MTEVVAALIRKGDCFLICQRPADRSRGSLWEFAGGKMEPGETLDKALVRECREKIGSRVRVGRKLGDVYYDYPDIAVHVTLFDTELVHGTPRPKCVGGVRWISPEEVEDYQFCPADAQLIAEVLDRSARTPEQTPHD